MRTKRLGFTIAILVGFIAAVAVRYGGGIRSNALQTHLDQSPDASSDEVRVEAKTPSLRAQSTTDRVVVGSLDKGSVCGPIEYLGSGPDGVSVDAQIWKRFMADYHQSKDDLVNWLHKNADFFSTEQIANMESDIRETRVMRPQTQVEPDLTWRGVPVWTAPLTASAVEGKREALIHVTDGFLKLYEKDRVRARFEITRALAQSWAPCSAQAGQNVSVWNNLMQCLGYSSEQAGCSVGEISESAWAASSAVAVLVSPPDCSIPAFQGDRFHACLGGFKRVESVSYRVEQPARGVASQTKGKE